MQRLPESCYIDGNLMDRLAPMNLPQPTPENERVLNEARTWFRDRVIASHVENTRNLIHASSFNINPFTVWYLARFIDGEVTPLSIAKALVLPRSMGTSIATSFGSQMQRFITDTLATAFGSPASGMDIEFKDFYDGHKKHSQIKLGPNTINRDDVTTIDSKFKSLRNLLRTNGVSLPSDRFVVAVMFGEPNEVNAFYQSLRDEHGWELLVGREFWAHLTGDDYFHDRLVEVIRESTEESDSSDVLAETLSTLAKDPEIIALSNQYQR